MTFYPGHKLLLRHGMSKSYLHNIWRKMKYRCFNTSDAAYNDYGGRGITVCERWRTFENFYADMGERPGPDYSLDRINNDGNYEPGNCRWATRSEQMLNKRKKKVCKRGHPIVSRKNCKPCKITTQRQRRERTKIG
jgi:hypothetical protein